MSAAAPYDKGEDNDEDEGRGSSAGSRRHLVPFGKGDPRQLAASRKGVEARKANAAARKLADAEPLRILRNVADEVDRGELGPLAAAAAVQLIAEVVAGRLRVRDPAAWLRVLVDVARLEEGQVTGLAATVHVQGEDVARARELRDLARRALDVDEVTDED